MPDAVGGKNILEVDGEVTYRHQNYYIQTKAYTQSLTPLDDCRLSPPY